MSDHGFIVPDFRNREGLVRKDHIIKIVASEGAISQKQLIAKCFVNYGWSKRSTRENTELLLEYGSLSKDATGELIIAPMQPTLTHSHTPLEDDLR